MDGANYKTCYELSEQSNPALLLIFAFHHAIQKCLTLLVLVFSIPLP